MATRSRSSSRRSSKSKSSGGIPVIDFTKAEDTGGGRRYREDDYLVKVLNKFKPGKSENKQTPFIEFAFKFLDGKYKGKKFTQRLYTSPKALWLLRSFIEAVGEDVPDKVRWREIGELVAGKEVIVTLTDNENPDTGRVTSQISDFLDPEEFDEDDDLDEEDVEDEEYEDEDEEIDDDEEDEDETDEEDEDEEEDDEEEPEPRRRRKSSSKSKSKRTRSRSRKRDEDDDDDDLEDIDLDDI